MKTLLEKLRNIGGEARAERAQFLVAVHLFLFSKGRVLLARRYNTGYEDGKHSVPAGHVEKGETVLAATIREAKEEIGVTLKVQDLRVAHVMHRLGGDGDERIDFFIVSKSWTGEPEICEPNKCDQLGWFNLEKLPSNIIPYVETGLEQVKNDTFFSEFGWNK